MSKKDYILIASVIRGCESEAKQHHHADFIRRRIAAELAIIFKDDNNRFDSLKFLEACSALVKEEAKA